MSGRTLSDLYRDHDHFMITAHRGASFEFPENTALAMRKAVEAGADMIEFDLRGTADGVPVLLHDETIDRTSDGHGMPEDHLLSELRKFRFSFWLQGMRRDEPAMDDVTIPTFEEILSEFRGKAAMNIQVYAKSEAVLKEICRLFHAFDMYDHGYFTVTPDQVEIVRNLDPDIEFCVTEGWETRSDPEVLRRAREKYGCRFVQPVREFSYVETFRRIRDLGMRANVFFADEPEQMQEIRAMGAQGILTNRAFRMCANRPGPQKP